MYEQAYESAPLQLYFAFPYFSFDLTSFEIDPSENSRKNNKNEAPNILFFKKTRLSKSQGAGKIDASQTLMTNTS